MSSVHSSYVHWFFIINNFWKVNWMYREYLQYLEILTYISLLRCSSHFKTWANLETTETNSVVSQTFCLIMNWLLVGRNVVWVRKTFLSTRTLLQTLMLTKCRHALVIVNTHKKSPCQPYWNCIKVFSLASKKNQR